MSWTILGGFDPYDYNACLCSAIFRHHKVAQIYFNLKMRAVGSKSNQEKQRQIREAWCNSQDLLFPFIEMK